MGRILGANGGGQNTALDDPVVNEWGDFFRTLDPLNII